MSHKAGRLLQQVIASACWLYLAASIVLWLILRQTGDRWWLATVFLFGPRWVWALPLIPLGCAAALLRRSSLWVLLLSAWVVLFPVMGFCLPWRLAIPYFRSGPRLRVLTCNLHGQEIDALAALVAATKPDVVAIQEWSFPGNPAIFEGSSWHCVTNDELFLASRYPISKMDDHSARAVPDPWVAMCCNLETPLGFVHFVNLRLASPHRALESVRWRARSAPDEIRSNSLLRLMQSQLISAYADSLGSATLLSGDFNLPEGSVIQRQCWSRFSDAFSTAGFGFGHTYYTRLVSTRIDHILFTTDWHCRRSWVGPDIGSAHRPLIADFEMPRYR